MTTSSERRLHPVSVVLEIGRSLSRLLLPMFVLLVATPLRGAAGVIFSAAIAALVVLTIGVAVARYLRFHYRYDPAELVIRSGVFVRNERKIPYARIQNLDATQNPIQRLFDVTAVHVQTGGGSEPEATLRVLPLAALREMRARVLSADAATAYATPAAPAVDATLGTAGATNSDSHTNPAEDATPPPAQPSRTLLELGPRDLVLAGVIENRGMVLIAGGLALLEQTGVLSEVIERIFRADDAALAGLAERWLGGGDVPLLRGALFAAAALIAALLFIRVLSTLWAVVRLYDFRLVRVGDELHTEYGMFTRVNATIPLRRVQTIVVRDGVLHRLFGRHRIVVETAGGAAIETGARLREPIAPILRDDQLGALLRELHPGFDRDALEWRRVHPRASGRMFRAALVWPAALAAASYFLVQQWALAVFAALVLVAFYHARLRARHLAWAVTDDAVVVRDGALDRATRVARFNRIQVVALHRNPFDVRSGMAAVRADTAGARGGVVVPYLPEDTAAALREELTARAEATDFIW